MLSFSLGRAFTVPAAVLATLVLLAPAAALPTVTSQAPDAAASAVTTQVPQTVEVPEDVISAALSVDTYEAHAPVVVAGAALHGTTNVRWPFDSAVITDRWGPRSCENCSAFHHGLDFAPGAGAAIPVAADGIVQVVGVDPDIGTYVTVAHLVDGVEVLTRYAHMASGSATVSEGQRITAGQTLGLVGDTGNQSHGAHLHFEVWLDDERTDPLPWLDLYAGRA